jgi:hypothetical protein
MYSLADFGLLMALIVIAAFAISFLVGYVTFDRKRATVRPMLGECWETTTASSSSLRSRTSTRS